MSYGREGDPAGQQRMKVELLQQHLTLVRAELGRLAADYESKRRRAQAEVERLTLELQRLA